MFRLLAALVLVRLLAQAVGIDMLIDSCETPCEECQSGDCSPDCDSCVCCPHQRLMTLQKTDEAPGPDARDVDFPAITSLVQDPREQEIFHIPKRDTSV